MEGCIGVVKNTPGTRWPLWPWGQTVEILNLPPTITPGRGFLAPPSGFDTQVVHGVSVRRFPLHSLEGGGTIREGRRCVNAHVYVGWVLFLGNFWSGVPV